ncbi:MAG: hypothetical protein HOV94_06780 [Saccharothrix sp.]|nr:hypothetical protein [Saccharothrix sp.]
MRKPTWLALAALLALTACGTPSDQGGVASLSGGASASASATGGGKADEDEMRELAKCMRENGVDMPDPTSDGKGGGMVSGSGLDATTEELEKAEEACKDFLPSGGELEKASPEEMDRLRERVKCLRDKGYQVEEPDYDSGRVRLPQDDSAEYREAMEECGFGEGSGE